MIRTVENNTQTPVCPHCDEEISEVSVQRMSSSLGVRYLYFCSICRKVLGVSHRKGFWMG
ncbi:MAG: hypothetical protein AAGA96_08070 [Verrucomicrobiota bacterium]